MNARIKNFGLFPGICNKLSHLLQSYGASVVLRLMVLGFRAFTGTHQPKATLLQIQEKDQWVPRHRKAGEHGAAYDFLQVSTNILFLLLAEEL
jgi:2-hydroxychromene-2-carboxylate isomerase